MRKEAVAGVVAILVVAGLAVGYLAISSSTPNGTSTTSASPFTYQTVILSTSLSTSVGGGASTTFVITSSSTLSTTWVQGDPIPVAMVETDNFSIPSGSAYVFNPNNGRIYVLGTSHVVVVDSTSHSVVANVSLPANNTGGSINAGLTIDASKGTVYASVQGEVVEISGSTDKIMGELPFGLRTLAFDSTTQELWGTMIGTDLGPDVPLDGSIVGVDVRTGSVLENASIGFAPFDIAVDPNTGMVYTAGCTNDFVCGSEAAALNGTSGVMLATVDLGSGDYPTMALDPATHVLYVSGGSQMAAIDGTTGRVIFNVNPQTCGPFTSIVVDTSSDLVFTAPVNYPYLLAYDGATGKLVNMYSFPITSTPAPIAINPSNGQLYVWTTSDRLLPIRLLSAQGNVNAALLGNSQECPRP